MQKKVFLDKKKETNNRNQEHFWSVLQEFVCRIVISKISSTVTEMQTFDPALSAGIIEFLSGYLKNIEADYSKPRVRLIPQNRTKTAKYNNCQRN